MLGTWCFPFCVWQKKVWMIQKQWKSWLYRQKGCVCSEDFYNSRNFLGKNCCFLANPWTFVISHAICAGFCHPLLAVTLTMFCFALHLMWKAFLSKRQKTARIFFNVQKAIVLVDADEVQPTGGIFYTKDEEARLAELFFVCFSPTCFYVFRCGRYLGTCSRS